MERKRKMGFAQSNIAYTLDALGRRYGQRPSQILGYHPLDGRGLLLDLAILQHVLETEAESETVGGKIKAKQAQWPPEVRRELKKQGLLH